MRTQSVSLGRARRARGRPRSPPAAGTGRAARRQRSAARERQQAALDQQPVPRPRFCSMSSTGSPSAPRRARRREAWISISATSPCTSALVGRELRQDAAEAQRLVAQRGAHPVVARGGRVALVEDEVDRPRAPRPGARRARRRAAPRTARAPRAACAWRARCAARWSAPGTRKARAISAVVSPPSSRRVSATRASRRQHAGGRR